MKLKIGEPSVVIRGETVDELGWGPYQFPGV